MEKRAIIITGNPVDGLSFIGPFESNAAACAWANQDPHLGEWWVSSLEPIEPNELDSVEQQAYNMQVAKFTTGDPYYYNEKGEFRVTVPKKPE